MGLFDFFRQKSEPVKKVSTRQKAIPKKRKRQRKVLQTGIEDPMLSVSRQLTQMQEEIVRVNTLLSSGFQGLREDHHRIVDDLANLENRKQALQSAKERIEDELELLDVDSKILDLLKSGKKRSVELSGEMGIARQYASQRLNALQASGFVKKVSQGRKVYYKLVKKAEK